MTLAGYIVSSRVVMSLLQLDQSEAFDLEGFEIDSEDPPFRIREFQNGLQPHDEIPAEITEFFEKVVIYYRDTLHFIPNIPAEDITVVGIKVPYRGTYYFLYTGDYGIYGCAYLSEDEGFCKFFGHSNITDDWVEIDIDGIETIDDLED